MDFLTLLTSLNKIGLFAFLITLGFLIFEVYLLVKNKKNNTVTEVPQFQEGTQKIITDQINVKEPFWKNITKSNRILISVLSILLIFFALIMVFDFVNRNQQETQSIAPTGSVSVDKNSKIRVPTGVVLVNKQNLNITKTGVDSNSEPSDLSPTSINPTQAANYTNNLTDTPVVMPTEIILVSPTEISVSPTIITELPLTSYFNNLLVILAVSTVFIFFAFLY